jgi:hypothetical protein
LTFKLKQFKIKLKFFFLKKGVFYILVFGVHILDFVFIFRHRTLSRSPHFAAFLSMTSVSALVIGLSPSLEGILVKPFVQIAEDLKARNPAASECIRYSGPLSATLSLALGPKLFHNRCEPQETKFLITPEWKAAECQETGFTEISHRGHLILCVKSIEPTK